MNIKIPQLGFLRLQVNIFFYALILFILGIIFKTSSYLMIIILATLGLYFIKLIICKQKLNLFFKHSCLLLGAFFLGGYLYQEQENKFKNFKQLTDDKIFHATGTIKDIVTIEHPRFRKKIIFKIDELHKCNSEITHKENKLIQIYTNSYKNIQIDNKLKIKDLFFKSLNNDFYMNYLIKENIAASLFVSKLSTEFISRKTFSFLRWIHKVKNYVFSQIKLKTNSESFALFSSIFLGNTKNCDQRSMAEFRDLFQIWGLSHYLARAGLHMLIIIFLWSILTSAFRINFHLQQFLLLTLIIIYYLLSWASIPFLRSLFMFILYKVCILLKLQINSLHLLNIACFSILVLSPFQIFSLDFQLSFGLTYALILLSISKQKNKLATFSSLSN